jgi:flagellar P-ring protein precursor FlgI
MRSIITLVLTAILLGKIAWSAPAARIKELAAIEGVRENPLIGYGLVVGLNNTGDRRQTLFSQQTLTNLLNQLGVNVPPAAVRVQNVAAVMVTASLPPFARAGSRIDVTVAAMGDATSLQGGLLLLTSLRGVDGRVYSIAQGPLVVGGYAAGNGLNSRTLNHPTTARIPNGATVEVSPPAIELAGLLRLQLRRADFTTAARIAEVINGKFPEALARAEDAAAVQVNLPDAFRGRGPAFLAEIERLAVEADSEEKVIVNERTGTVVMGANVRIRPATIMHGALTVEIQTTFEVSQPAPFSRGSTQVVPQTAVNTREEKAQNVVLGDGATVEDLVRGLKGIGATARDIIAILQSLKSAGALQAELEVN